MKSYFNYLGDVPPLPGNGYDHSRSFHETCTFEYYVKRSHIGCLIKNKYPLSRRFFQITVEVLYSNLIFN